MNRECSHDAERYQQVKRIAAVLQRDHREEEIAGEERCQEHCDQRIVAAAFHDTP